MGFKTIKKNTVNRGGGWKIKLIKREWNKIPVFKIK